MSDADITSRTAIIRAREGELDQRESLLNERHGALRAMAELTDLPTAQMDLAREAVFTARAAAVDTRATACASWEAALARTERALETPAPTPGIDRDALIDALSDRLMEATRGQIAQAVDAALAEASPAGAPEPEPANSAQSPLPPMEAANDDVSLLQPQGDAFDFEFEAVDEGLDGHTMNEAPSDEAPPDPEPVHESVSFPSMVAAGVELPEPDGPAEVDPPSPLALEAAAPEPPPEPEVAATRPPEPERAEARAAEPAITPEPSTVGLLETAALPSGKLQAHLAAARADQAAREATEAVAAAQRAADQASARRAEARAGAAEPEAQQEARLSDEMMATSAGLPALDLKGMLGAAPRTSDPVGAAVRALFDGDPDSMDEAFDETISLGEPGLGTSAEALQEALAQEFADLDDSEDMPAEEEAPEDEVLQPLAAGSAMAALAFGSADALDPFSQLDIDPPDVSVSGRIRVSRPLRAELAVSVGFEHGAQFATGFSVNIGSAGMLVASSSPPAAGARLKLFFEMPDGHSVSAPAEVRWVRYGNEDQPTGMGVEFVVLEYDDRVIIERYVAALGRQAD